MGRDPGQHKARLGRDRISPLLITLPVFRVIEMAREVCQNAGIAAENLISKNCDPYCGKRSTSGPTKREQELEKLLEQEKRKNASSYESPRTPRGAGKPMRGGFNGRQFGNQRGGHFGGSGGAHAARGFGYQGPAGGFNNPQQKESQAELTKSKIEETCMQWNSGNCDDPASCGKKHLCATVIRYHIVNLRNSRTRVRGFEFGGFESTDLNSRIWIRGFRFADSKTLPGPNEHISGPGTSAGAPTVFSNIEKYGRMGWNVSSQPRDSDPIISSFYIVFPLSHKDGTAVPRNFSLYNPFPVPDLHIFQDHREIRVTKQVRVELILHGTSLHSGILRYIIPAMCHFGNLIDVSQ